MAMISGLSFQKFSKLRKKFNIRIMISCRVELAVHLNYRGERHKIIVIK
jgi:hypothetical protein